MKEVIGQNGAQCNITAASSGSSTCTDQADVTPDDAIDEGGIKTPDHQNIFFSFAKKEAPQTHLHPHLANPQPQPQAHGPAQLTPVRVAPAIPTARPSSANNNDTLPRHLFTKPTPSHNYSPVNHQSDIKLPQQVASTTSTTATRGPNARGGGNSAAVRSGPPHTGFGGLGGTRRLSQQAERAVVSFIRSSQSEVAPPLVRSNSFTLQDLDRARKSIQASLEADEFDITGITDDATYRYFHSLSPSSAVKARRFSKSLPELYHSNNLKGFPITSTGMSDEYNYFSHSCMENGDVDDDDDEDDACTSSSRDIPDSSAWRGKDEFYFTAISLALGLNTLVRFPYFAYKFHSGSFLLAFTICTFFIALPILTIEYALGQLARRGPITAFGSLCPLLRGVPIAAAIVSLLSSLVYSTINSWSIFYFFKSFFVSPQWSMCSSTWNSIECNRTGRMLKLLPLTTTTTTTTVPSILDVASVTVSSISNIFNSTPINLLPTPLSLLSLTAHNDTSVELIGANDSHDYSDEHENDSKGTEESPSSSLNNIPDLANLTEAVYCNSILPTQEFFDRKVLEMHLNPLENIQWELIIFVFVTWIIVFISLRKKILFSSRPSSCFSLLPYGILAVLFIRAILLKESRGGIFYFLKPKWNQLLNPALWSHAAALSLHSLGCILGISFAKATCNRERNNFLIDAFFVTIINLTTVVFVGVIVFATLGHLAWKRSVDISSVIVSDAGVAFVAFSELLSLITFTSFWSVIFFFTLFCLGLDYQISVVRAFLVAIEDAYGSSVKRNFLAHQIFTLILCLVSFMATLIFLTPQGLLLLQLFDQYISVVLTLVLAFFQVILMAWFYGGYNLAQVIRLKISKRLGYYLPCCWNFITPLALLVILIWNAVLFKEPTFRDDKTAYPLLMQVCVVALVIILLMLLPLIGCHQVNRSNRGSFFTRLMASCKPVQREMPNIPLVAEYDYSVAPQNANQTLPLTCIQADKFSPPPENAIHDPPPHSGNRNYIITTQKVTGTSSSCKNSIPKIRKQPIAATIPTLFNQPEQDSLSPVKTTDESIVTPHPPDPITTTNGTTSTSAIVSASDEATFATIPMAVVTIPMPIMTTTVITTPTISATCPTTNGHTVTPNSPIDEDDTPLIRIPVTFSLIRKLDRETDL